MPSLVPPGRYPSAAVFGRGRPGGPGAPAAAARLTGAVLPGVSDVGAAVAEGTG